jgi:uncharacterized protein (TIRG00374 family)
MATESSAEPTPTAQGISKRKLIIGTILFLGLTVGAFWYQIAQMDKGDAGPTWEHLRWGFMALIILLLPIEPLCTTARIWVVCRVLHPGVSFWSCFKADCANMGLAMLTPSQTGGGFAQIYILYRAGVKVGTALTISLLSFLGTLIVLLGMGMYSILFGEGGESAGALFSVAVWAVTISVGLMLAGALLPGVFRAVLAAASRTSRRMVRRQGKVRDWRPPGAPEDSPVVDRMGPLTAKLVDIIYTYRRDAGRFLAHGKIAFLLVVLFTLGFLLMRCVMAYLAVRFLGIEAGFVEVIEIQMALIFIVYFAPTPGSAGVAESASFVAMGSIVHPGFAPYYNLLWRFLTGYVWALAGLLFLGRAVVADAKTALQTKHAALKEKLQERARTRHAGKGRPEPDVRRSEPDASRTKLEAEG